MVLYSSPPPPPLSHQTPFTKRPIRLSRGRPPSEREEKSAAKKLNPPVDQNFSLVRKLSGPGATPHHNRALVRWPTHWSGASEIFLTWGTGNLAAFRVSMKTSCRCQTFVGNPEYRKISTPTRPYGLVRRDVKVRDDHCPLESGQSRL